MSLILASPRRSHLQVVLAMTFLFVLSTGAAGGDNILAGTDAFVTEPASTEATVPFPADHFGTGSDPFVVTIQFQGEDLKTANWNIIPADTLVERQMDANIQCGESAQIDIELVALDLVSTTPIIVPFDGNTRTELWNVRACVSLANPSLGTMTINHDCLDGGTFSSQLQVIPRFVFTRISDGATETWDDGTILKDFSADGFWVHDPMQLRAVRIPTGTVVDGDCDGSFETTLQGTTNFFPGIRPDPCMTCMPVTDVTKTLEPTPHETPDDDTHQVEPALGRIFKIPTLSGWALILVALLLALTGAWGIYRRRQAARS